LASYLRWLDLEFGRLTKAFSCSPPYGEHAVGKTTHQPEFGHAIFVGEAPAADG
jgi:hypothetical protein